MNCTPPLSRITRLIVRVGLVEGVDEFLVVGSPGFAGITSEELSGATGGFDSDSGVMAMQLRWLCEVFSEGKCDFFIVSTVVVTRPRVDGSREEGNMRRYLRRSPPADNYRGAANRR
jgi:hypothetical protein